MVTCRWVHFPSPRWSVIYFLEPYTNFEAAAGRNCINTEKNVHTIWNIFYFSSFLALQKASSLPFLFPFFSFFIVSSCINCGTVITAPNTCISLFYFHSGHFYLLCINCGTIIDAPCRYTAGTFCLREKNSRGKKTKALHKEDKVFFI